MATSYRTTNRSLTFYPFDPDTEDIVFVTVNSGKPVTVKLADATQYIGQILRVVRVNAANGTNCTVNCQSSQTISGLSSVTLTNLGDSLTVISDGANWQQVGPGSAASITGIATVTAGNSTITIGGTTTDPTVAVATITDTQVAAANKDGAANVVSLRTLGSSATQALAGNTKLDQLQAPTDVTTLNASTSAHGLLPKLDNSSAHFLNGQGVWTIPSVSTPPYIDARDYGFTANANAINVDTAWSNLITTLAGGVPPSTTVKFPTGIFSQTTGKSLPLVPGLKLEGMTGNPHNDGATPNAYQGTTFRYDGGSGSVTMLTQDGGTSPFKGGAALESISFYNNKAADFTINAFKTNNVNDWSAEHCGFTNFGRAFWCTASGGGGPDNAHSMVNHCFSYGNNYYMYLEGGFGWNVQGGEIIGGSGQMGFYQASGATELKIFGTKAVGCRNGYAVLNGGLNKLFGVESEGCGDSTHPWLDLLSDGTASNGAGNFAFGYTASSAAGGGGELPARVGANTSGNVLIGYHAGDMGNHPGYRVGEVRDVAREGGSYLNIILDAYIVQFGYPSFTKFGVNGAAYKQPAAGNNIE